MTTDETVNKREARASEPRETGTTGRCYFLYQRSRAVVKSKPASKFVKQLPLLAVRVNVSYHRSINAYEIDLSPSEG
jgi:hypothetical protein